MVRDAVKEVARYKGKYGDIIVECYAERRGMLYHVRYEHPRVTMNSFWDSKREAIIEAQFLAANY